MAQKLNPEYIRVLKRIQQFGYKDAVIAGGACRDAYFGNSPTDIDIFVAIEDPNTQDLKYDLTLTRLQNSHDVMDDLSGGNSNIFDSFRLAGTDTTTETVYDANLNWIQHVWNYTHHENITRVETIKLGTSLANTTPQYVTHKYQIIVVDGINIKDYVEHYFDIGICQCWNDGTRTKYTNNFMKDVLNKTLTVCGKMSNKELEYVLAVHLPKIKEKFPGFTTIITPEIIEY